jgi:hypothetical protein
MWVACNLEENNKEKIIKIYSSIEENNIDNMKY